MTISCVMIVKNEEKILARCLDSIRDLMDEIIIVDTGSSDKTREIAAKYTDKIYDFAWTGDFSDARNFAFSKATMDYIYSADADEVLDDSNHIKFMALKTMLPDDVEIVQMRYGNQLQHSTVYNFDEELRPKMFKRLRQFVWQEPVHEMVRLDPVVYDSDIVITHMPEGNHGHRDLEIFSKATTGGGQLSKRLYDMYVRELFIVGTEDDFRNSLPYFVSCAADVDLDPDSVNKACLVISHTARIHGDIVMFFKYITKLMASDPSSEVCLELGLFYERIQDFEEAAIWFYNAAFETVPAVVITSSGRDAAEGLKRVYDAMGMPEVGVQFAKDIEAKG
ncbi:MAG: glycosyltransferase family 2 protein [Lachnospiraceae bacterium]|nr:glycosyltransferase family 2 protein [Lachnospiraceae bacterium]